jgi:L-ascorbate metabolism protein UlaG (beta-lactamase superfamily)
MRIRRLGWAGIELEEQGTKVAIDPLGTLGFFPEFHGPEPERDELVQLPANSLEGILLTHLHRDHTDPDAVAAALAPDGIVAGPAFPRTSSPHQQYAVEPQETGLKELGIQRTAHEPGQTLSIGPLDATACSSVDGVGAAQIAWLVRAGDQSVLHCGDTLWHGGFWEIAAEHGAPTIVCLPANGVVIDFPFNQPAAGQPADLDPEQAVAAAKVLGAGSLMPIHFSRTYEHDPMYRPTTDTAGRLTRAAAESGVAITFPTIGEWLEVAAPVAV